MRFILLLTPPTTPCYYKENYPIVAEFILFIFPLEYFLSNYSLWAYSSFSYNCLLHTHTYSHKNKVENILNRIFWWTLYSNLIWRINKNIQTSSSSCFWILPFYLWSSWVGFILRLVLLSYYSTNGNNNREAGEGRPFKNVEEIAMALENCKLFPKTSHLDLLVPTPSWYGKGMTKEGKGSFFSFKIFQIDWIFAGFPLDVCIYAVLVIVATLSHSLSLISCVLALQWRHTFPASLWQRWIRFEFCIRVQHNENISGLWCGLFTLCGREFEWKEY